MSNYYISFSLHNVKKCKYTRDKKTNEKLTKEEFTYHYIMVSVAWDRKRVRTILKDHIEENLWDKNKHKAKGSSKDPRRINDILVAIESNLKDFYDKTEKEHKRVPTVNETKDILESIIRNRPLKVRQMKDGKKTKTFMQSYEDFLDATKSGNRLTPKGKPIKASSLTAYNTTKVHLTEFLKTMPHITFDEIDDNFFVKLTKYMCDKRLSNNSQGRLVRNIKTFMHWASEKELHSSKKFIKLIVFNEETTQVALNESELEAIENLCDLTPRLERIKDLFLAQIYTGMRSSDLFNLRPGNINYTEKKITLTMIKTRKTILIPITPQLKSILKKYDGQLPKISPQKYNDGIKDLCKTAEINSLVPTTFYIGEEAVAKFSEKYQLISSHTARRSFVTISLNRGATVNNIMKITGHDTLKSFFTYIRGTQDEAVKELAATWGKKRKPI